MGGPWPSSRLRPLCAAPATLSSAPRPAATLQSTPPIPATRRTPRPPTAPSTHRTRRKRRAATATSDPAPTGPPNLRPRATWSGYEWKKGGRRERGRRERRRSAPRTWRRRRHSGRPSKRRRCRATPPEFDFMVFPADICSFRMSQYLHKLHIPIPHESISLVFLTELDLTAS